MLIIVLIGINYMFSFPDGFIYQNYSPILYIQMIFEVSLATYTFSVTVLLIVYGTFSLVLAGFVYFCQLTDLNKELQKSSSKIQYFETYATLIRRYRLLHSTIWRNLLLAKVQLIDNLIFSVIASNALINVLAVQMLLYRGNDLTLINRLILGAGLAGECLLVLYSGGLISEVCVCLHASARHLHLAAVYLKRLPDKLKVMAYYELVHSRQRLVFKIGTLAKIDREGFVEVGATL